MDERYLKRAEDALYGKLGAVLGLPGKRSRRTSGKPGPKWPVILTKRSSDGPEQCGAVLSAKTIRRGTESRFSA